MNEIIYLNKAKLIDLDNEKLVVKKRKKDIEKIYLYLENRDFYNYLKPISIDEKEEIYPFIRETPNLENSEKATDLVYLTSMLHSKTTTFKSVNEDEVKSRYEDTVSKLNDAFSYYTKLQDEIEEHIYMSPAENLLMKNISKIYEMLNISREHIERYLKKAKEQRRERNSLLHGNLSIEHIVENENKYLISWNNSHFNIPVYDLVDFYQNEFDKVEFAPLYEIYQSKYSYTEEEKDLFFSLINIPRIIKLDKSNYINSVSINRLVEYIDKTILFTLEENEKYQEPNDEEFEK